VLLVCAELMPLAGALAAGLVFAVHPVHVEAVANAVGLAELASTVALLAACLVHVRGPDRSRWREALLIGFLYAVGFGAKESGATLPGLLFLLDAARRRISLSDLGAYARDRWPVYGATLAVAALMLAGRYAVLGTIAHPLAPLGADLLTEIPRIWTLGEIWTHYVRLWVFPLDLSVDYAPNVIPISLAWHAGNVAGVAVALLILVTALVAWRAPDMRPGSDTARAAAFGVVWFVIAVSPASNVVFLSGVLLAERILYLPSVGLAAATGWLVVRLARERSRVAWSVFVLLLAVSSVRAWVRTPVWKDNQRLFLAMVRDAPHSGRSQWILGDEFLRAGNVSQGLLAYRAAIDILGGHYTVMTEIAQRLMRIGKPDAAEALLLLARNDIPELPLAPSLIAWLRAQDGDAAGTEKWARESLSLYEPDATRWHLLAWALATRGAWDEAREARRRGDELGRARFWHQWMYQAYVRRQDGDSEAAFAAVDSAWAGATDERARRVVDSVRVADFGLAPLLEEPGLGQSPEAS